MLSRDEVARLIVACPNPKHRLMLETCYGCGLRVSELVALRVSDIDGERRLLRIEQGKGAKDRQALIAPALLERLRQYWREQRPKTWLFPSERQPQCHLNISTAQGIYHRAKARAGIDKVGGIHSLRHAYATHQLEQGLPVHQLQRLLGHNNLQSTLRYVHWIPSEQREGRGFADLVAHLRSIMASSATVQSDVNRFLDERSLDRHWRKICGHLQACRTEAMCAPVLRAMQAITAVRCAR